MALYVRKSVSVGPFRFNISKSGAGVSVGTKGLRVGTGPRGNYIHMGRGGLYYRTTLPSGSKSQNRNHTKGANSPTPGSQAGTEMVEIDSEDASTIMDSTSADLVSEMNKKRQMVAYWPIIALITFGLSLYLATTPTATEGLLLSTFISSVVVTAIAAYFDKLRKTTVLMYDLEDAAAEKYQKLHEAFHEFANCGGKWHISASGNIADKKYHAGASIAIDRKAILITNSEPPYIKSNLSAPCIPVGKQKLYFFPDKIFIFESRGVGAISYENLSIEFDPHNFVESEHVPKDAKVVGSTWQYVNKSGGPDKRFKDNKKFPIALYEEIAFTSSTGLNEVVQVSKVGIGRSIASSINELAVFSS